MIKAEKIRKRFGVKEALGGISCCIPDGSIYGLVGSNGAGKSTLLRVLSGVYRPDEGNVLVDEGEVWENAEAKGQIAFVADEVYFPAGATAERMAQLTASMDPAFDMARLNYLMGLFQLDPKAQLGSFSKGMKRQAAIALALSRRPKYLLLDEAFDGLDPVMRRLVRGLFAEEILDRLPQKDGYFILREEVTDGEKHYSYTCNSEKPERRGAAGSEKDQGRSVLPRIDGQG